MLIYFLCCPRAVGQRWKRLSAVSHRARLDVPSPLLKAVTGWIARHRRRPGARPRQRAASVHAQVVLVLRGLRHRADLHTLAGDTGVGQATAYRYLHEGLDVIAAHAPDLLDVLTAAHTAGTGYLCLDGTMDMNIAIRTLILKQDDLYFQVGGGIVYDSDPEAEYDETLHKAESMMEALAQTCQPRPPGKTATPPGEAGREPRNDFPTAFVYKNS